MSSQGAALISQSRMVMFWAKIKQVEENPKNYKFTVSNTFENVQKWQFLLTMGDSS